LCEYLLADATLLAYHDRIRAVVDAAPALEERIISDYVVILDRLPLREKLALLEPDASPVKVLLVRGEPRSGKSHGRYLFERSARDQGALPVYLCEGIVATVDDVVRELFSALDASSEIPPRLTTEDAWYRVVCSKLRELASSKQRPLWIAVDDLGPAADGGPLLDSQIKQFCDQMALNMVNPAFRQWFRLMLIHYPDGQVPTRWKRDFWTEDRTNPMDVRQADVEVLLREWSSRHETIIEDELTTLAAAVLARADAPETPDEAEAPRLQRLHDALVETLNTLAGR
jgi:adenosyl cobinamide kinase/adenosyl cobinamide phosphate guanylyltransferase